MENVEAEVLLPELAVRVPIIMVCDVDCGAVGNCEAEPKSAPTGTGGEAEAM